MITAGSPGLPAGMHALFPSLAPELQVRALQTMALLWQSDPPRHDISLEAVSEALLAAQRLLDGARAGHWAQTDLRNLEAQVAAVGGCLAPGLRSSGPDSLQWWRQTIHEPLRQLLQPPVLAAAEAALGSLLQRHQPDDLRHCFTLLRQELAPLQQDSPVPWADALLDLEPQRQIAVFRAWQAALPSASLTPTIAAFAAEARLLRTAAIEGSLLPALQALAAALHDAGAPLVGLPDAEALTAVAAEARPGVLQLLQAEFQQRPPHSAVELLHRLQALCEAELMAVPPQASQAAADLAVLERYDVTADALRRRIVSDLIDTVTFPEQAMADVISELMQDLAIPPPYPSRLDPEWLQTLLPDTRIALMESWEDLRLRHWIESHLHDRASELFRERASDFDRFVYETIQVSDAELARKLHQMLELSASSFGELAARYSEGEERWTRGLVGPVRASELAPELRALLTRLRPDEIHPPCRLDGDLCIVRLLHLFPARLDQALHQQLMWELFEQDLDASVSLYLDQIDQGTCDLPGLFQSLSLLPAPAHQRLALRALP